jgi:hypothetical protein
MWTLKYRYVDKVNSINLRQRKYISSRDTLCIGRECTQVQENTGLPIHIQSTVGERPFNVLVLATESHASLLAVE